VFSIKKNALEGIEVFGYGSFRFAILSTFFSMKNIIRFGSFALLFLFLAIPAFAEEALSEATMEQTMMTEEATTTSENPSLSRGALYRMRSLCSQILDHAKWKECRTKALNLRKVSTDARRATRDEPVKDQAAERSDGTGKPVKKILPKNFVDFSRHNRNYDYLRESPRTTENHVRFRAERLKQRVKHGGAGQRSRMMEDESEDVETE